MGGDGDASLHPSKGVVEKFRLLCRLTPAAEITGPAPPRKKCFVDKTECSLDGHELGTSGGTDTDLTVTNGLVSHGVLTKVVTNHVSSDLDGVPVLSGVDFGNGTDHLGHDDAVSEMGLDRLGLLSVRALLHGLDQSLNKTVVAGLDSTSEASLLAGAEHVDNLRGGELKKLLELDTSINLLSECFFLGSLCGLSSSKSFGDRGHI